MILVIRRQLSFISKDKKLDYSLFILREDNIFRKSPKFYTFSFFINICKIGTNSLKREIFSELFNKK
jgi:hypothetical protein